MKEFKHLRKDKDRHGNLRIYLRVPGKQQVRIREEPGTPAFAKAYSDALQESGEPGNGASGNRGSLRSLCAAYYRSAEYKALGARTRHVRRQILDRICQSKIPNGTPRGSLPYRLLERRHVRQLRDDRSDAPEAANGDVKALRQVFRWAMDADIIDINPAAAVPYLRPKNPDGHHTWTVPEVRQFIERHPIGTKAYLALCIYLFTGVRRSDAVLLGRHMEQNGSLHFRETKGSARIVKEHILPILAPLRAAIDAYPSGQITYLVTAFGQPYTANGFGNWFKRRCREAGLDHCSAHGLRKAGATIAANNGASDRQLMAIYGWETARQAGEYTRQANRNKLAAGAMHLLIPEQDEDKNCPTGEVMAVPPLVRRYE